MWENFWNVAGIIGLFGFLFFSICTLVLSTFLKRKWRLYFFAASLCLILFVTSTILFSGEEEISEEIADPVKIYQRGIENEKKGVFERAKKDYEVVLRLDSQNENAVERLQLIERREIALTFLQVARMLRRKGKYARCLVKLKVAEEIAPPSGTLEDYSNLKHKIKKEMGIARQLISETSHHKG